MKKIQELKTWLFKSRTERYYDFSKGWPIKNLKIKIGSSNLPRFCCACHKLNLAVRHPIESHGAICKILSKINSSNASIRRLVKLNNVFADKKCRLRIENLTRWSSSFLMLESVKRAYNKGAFNDENEELRCHLKIRTPKIRTPTTKPTNSKVNDIFSFADSKQINEELKKEKVINAIDSGLKKFKKMLSTEIIMKCFSTQNFWLLAETRSYGIAA